MTNACTVKWQSLAVSGLQQIQMIGYPSLCFLSPENGKSHSYNNNTTMGLQIPDLIAARCLHESPRLLRGWQFERQRRRLSNHRGSAPTRDEVMNQFPEFMNILLLTAHARDFVYCPLPNELEGKRWWKKRKRWRKKKREARIETQCVGMCLSAS